MATKLAKCAVDLIIPRGTETGEWLAATNRKYGGFSAPAGKVEEQESFEEAAWRELAEETGITSPQSFQHLAAHVIDVMPHDGQNATWVCMAYLVIPPPDFCPREVEPGTKLFWATEEKFRKESLYPTYYNWLFDLISALRHDRGRVGLNG